jgi:hypothetical protein
MDYVSVKDTDKLLARFKAPIKDDLYAHAYIWGDKISMLDAVAETDSRAFALCLVLPQKVDPDTGERAPGQNKYAELHFIQGNYGVGRVTHELMHLVLFLREDNLIEDDEEMCTIAGSMAISFWEQCFEWMSENES